MNIVIIAFNYAQAGQISNGPGMCLENFSRILQENTEYKVDVFTELPHPKTNNISDTKLLESLIRRSDIIIYWSGLTLRSQSAAKLANKFGKCLILGPNLIDTVEYSKERKLLSSLSFNKILTVNDRLKFLISKKHNISSNLIDVLMIGPNLKIWEPTGVCDNSILWKGNSRHFVKDVNFALKIKDKLSDRYNFKFLGYPNPYNYNKHIAEAKKSKLFICTSLSETMCLAMVEQWSAGIPSVTHPKIYLHGANYKTGIIVSRGVDEYVEAIEEIMEDEVLYKNLSTGAKNFVKEHFSDKAILKKFNTIIQ